MISTERKIVKMLAELEEALVQAGVDAEEAKDLIDSFEEDIEEMFQEEDQDDDPQEEE